MHWLPFCWWKKKSTRSKTLSKREANWSHLFQSRKPGVLLHVKKLGFKFLKPSCLTVILRSNEAPSPGAGKPTRCLKAQPVEAHACPDTCSSDFFPFKTLSGGMANRRVKNNVEREITHPATPFPSLHLRVLWSLKTPVDAESLEGLWCLWRWQSDWVAS